MAGGPLAPQGPPAAKGSVAGAKTLSLLSSVLDPLKPCGGVHTFLRIRPPSPSSTEEPPCIGYLCAPIEPSSVAPPRQLEPPQGRSLLPAAAQGGPSSSVRSGQPHAKNFSGLPSLTIGRTRALTSIPMEDEPLLKKALEGKPCEPPNSARSHGACSSAAVMVLPASVERIAAPAGKGYSLKRQRGPATEAPLYVGADACASARGGPELAFASLPVCDEGCVGQKGFEGPFKFGGLLQPHATQDDVFQRVGRPAADALLQGLNACIAVHGASGSGKTYTMVGPHIGTSSRLRRSSSITSSSSSSTSRSSSSWGLALRTIDFVMRALEARQKGADPSSPCPEVWLSAGEVYCDKLRDLLGPPKNPQADLRTPGLALPTGVLGAPRPLRVHSAAEAVSAALSAFTQRVSRDTAANSSSSRSHAILTLSVAYPGAARTGSRLYLLDLAGAERQQYAETWGIPQRAAPAFQSSRHHPPPKALLALEAASISKSLTAFMAVIAALGRQCAAAKLRGGNSRKVKGLPHDRPLQPKCEGSQATPVKKPLRSASTRPYKGPLDGPPAAKGTVPERAGGLGDLLGAPRMSLQAQPSGGPHMRFRDSRLTMALKEVLGIVIGRPFFDPTRAWRALLELLLLLLLVSLVRQDGCGHVALVFTVNGKGSSRGPTLQTLRFAALASLLGPFALKGSRGPTNGERGLVLRGQRLTRPAEAPTATRPSNAKSAATPAATTAPHKATKPCSQPLRPRRPLAVRTIATAAGALPRIQRAHKTPLGPPFLPSANFVSLAREPTLIRLGSDSAAASFTRLTTTAEPRTTAQEALSKHQNAEKSCKAALMPHARGLLARPLTARDVQVAIERTKGTADEKAWPSHTSGGAPAKARGPFNSRRRLKKPESCGVPNKVSTLKELQILCPPSTNSTGGPPREEEDLRLFAQHQHRTHLSRCMRRCCRSSTCLAAAAVSSQARANSTKLPGSSSPGSSTEAPAAPAAVAAAAAAASSAVQAPNGAAAAAPTPTGAPPGGPSINPAVWQRVNRPQRL
ncbi:hypothetical protein Esti_004478 [Eimeria stiedai]